MACVLKKEKYLGRRYGRLTILDCYQWQSSSGKFRTKAICLCDCGITKHILIQGLIGQATVSCGCFHKEYNSSDARPRFRVHGLAGKDKAPEYNIWKEMRARCNRISHPDFKHYGARGIKVCKRWDNYPNFIKNMGPRPSSKHSIDRIDNNKGYSPNNCKWSTQKEQMNNSRPAIKARELVSECTLCSKKFTNRTYRPKKFCQSSCYMEFRKIRK